MKPTLRSLAVMLIPALSACASDTVNYPSLARREVEWAVDDPPVAASVNSLQPASARLEERLAGLVAQARAAHDNFIQRRGRAERLALAARGAGLGSESWSVASIALADLESARSDAMIALADVDEMHIAAKIAGNDDTAISAARSQISAWIGEQDSVLASLRAHLGG